MSDFKNRVIIVGTDNHNTLSVIRDIGRHACDVHALVHSINTDLHSIKVSKSKYTKGKTAVVADTQEAIYEWLIENKEVGRKTILIPCSDLAAYTFDYYYKELSEFYVLPGFIDQPGKVIELMDKYNQKKFAIKHQLPMADTWQINPFEFRDTTIVPFPCILKPEVSAKGKKSDIRVCDDTDELNSAIEELKEAGYTDVVLQRFLKKTYEISAFGCITNDYREVKIGGYIKKLREWPINGGSMVAGVFYKSAEVDELVKRVSDVLYSEGYRGLYDYDIIVCNDGVYLIEINFRHSGNGFGLITNKISTPYLYCCSCINGNTGVKGNLEPPLGKIIMEEVSDFKYHKKQGVSTGKWMKEFISASYSVLDIHDIPGSFAFVAERFGNLIKKI